MTAELNFSDLYWNRKLMDFFFRTQAEETFNELLDRAPDVCKALNDMDDAFDDMSLDEVEEIFYNETVKDIADMYDIEIEKDENENEEDE